MPKIIKGGVVYTQDASALATELTTGSLSVENSSGHLEVKDAAKGYVMGDASTGAAVSGQFKIFSGTADPLSLPGLGSAGDIYLKKVS